MADRANPVYDGACEEPASVSVLQADERPVHANQGKQQVFMSMVRAGAELRRPRLLAAGLTLLAAVLLLVDISLGVHYSKLTDGRISFDDVTHINEQLIRIHHDYLISMESMRYANKQLAKEITQHQLSNWELDHQNKRRTDSEALNGKLHGEIIELQAYLTVTAEGCKRCLPGWIFAVSRCYYIPPTRSRSVKTWQQSRDFCQANGGDLATVDSKEKQLLIVSHFRMMNLEQNRGYDSKSAWIGLRDIQDEGTWKWLDGTTLAEGYWNIGQPSNNGGDSDCVLVLANSNPFRSWRDSSCRSRYSWICEMSPRTTS
ncbi:uncharacterized protein LOC143009543 [Genypterus blacodes]|uniref:uncharacterized protein LOC143009543 n=1 Tax=Genypterus blacodes TaxID=154954 RepID=UPI003F7635AA